MDEWKRKSLSETGFSKVRFKSFVDFAFANHPTFDTDSVVVIKDGHLVYEKYANGYKRDQKHAIFSLGKTMINALFGVMEHKGILNRNDQARRHYPKIDSYGNKDATITDLLQMSSGIEWIEEDRKNLLQSDPWFALYTRDSYQDMPAFIVRRPTLAASGTRFNYSTGDSALLVAAMRGALGEHRYANFAWEELFDKIGMKTVAIEQDLKGNPGLHGLAYASPLDIARLGLLYLTKGNVNGVQMLPPDWVEFSTRMAPAQLNPPDPNDRNLQNNQAYGAQVWLNVKRPFDRQIPYPELPQNAIIGMGTRGQILLVLPDQKIVMVRTATDSELFLKNRQDFRHKFFGLFFKSINGARP